MDKTQFFLAAKSVSTKTDYLLRYGDSDSAASNTEILYEETQTMTEASLGVRFINYANNMMSIISINAYSFGKSKIDTTASKGDTKYTLSQAAKIEPQSTSIRIGFGVLFKR